MRDDEKFVIQSLATALSGGWEPGGDPPDAHLKIGGKTIGVEISTLTQHITDAKGTRPRPSDDKAVSKLADGLNAELNNVVPDGTFVLLTLTIPVIDIKKTKADLHKEIASLFSGGTLHLPADRTLLIRGNRIELSFREAPQNENKKVVAAFLHRSSNRNIAFNAQQILEACIRMKTLQCASLTFLGPLWLALLNDYWLAEADVYRRALETISVAHPFEKILLVSTTGSVDILFTTTPS